MIAENVACLGMSSDDLLLRFVGTQRFPKNCGSHIDASLSRQPLVKGERLVRYEVNAVMLRTVVDWGLRLLLSFNHDCCALCMINGNAVDADAMCPACWAEARLKIARMTLTIKLDGNWSSFQLANSAPPLSVTDSAIAPSARMVRSKLSWELKEGISATHDYENLLA